MRIRIALLAAALALAATGRALAIEFWVQGTGTVKAAEDKEAAFLYAYQSAVDAAEKKCTGGFAGDTSIVSQKIEYRSAEGIPAWTGTVTVRMLCHADNG
jgi:hypothetical protein